MERGVEKAEFLNRPLLDRNIGEPLPQRLRGLLGAQERRGDEERRLAVKAVGELP
jgi:hypothetical protein